MATKQTTKDSQPEGGETYRYLERREHPWRRELFIKGRNMTAGHLVYAMRANKLSLEEAAEDFDLPVDAVNEARHYYERNRKVVEEDVEEERRRIEAAATHVGPAAVPGRLGR